MTEKTHESQRPWRDRLTDRALNLVGTKFIGTLLVIALATIGLFVGVLNGAEWVAASLGAVGVHGSANAIITSRYARGTSSSSPVVINHRPRTFNRPTMSATEPDALEDMVPDDGVYP